MVCSAVLLLSKLSTLTLHTYILSFSRKELRLYVLGTCLSLALVLVSGTSRDGLSDLGQPETPPRSFPTFSFADPNTFGLFL